MKKYLTKLGAGSIGMDPSAGVLAFSEKVMVNAVSKYPAGLCRCAQLNQIVLVEYLFVPGDRYAEAIILHADHVMVLCVDLLGRGLPLERRFHHELFHAIEHTVSANPNADQDWMELNATGFEYGALQKASSGSRRDQGAPIPVGGFLSEYATWSPAEDKAETCSFLFAMPDLVERRAAEDPVIARKVALLKSRLRQTCPHVVGFE